MKLRYYTVKTVRWGQVANSPSLIGGGWHWERCHTTVRTLQCHNGLAWVDVPEETLVDDNTGDNPYSLAADASYVETPDRTHV